MKYIGCLPLTLSLLCVTSSLAAEATFSKDLVPVEFNLAKEVLCQDGTEFNVPVPADMDGDLWSVFGAGFTFGDFCFDNIPNILSASPNIALVPRELAVKDGLSLVSE